MSITLSTIISRNSASTYKATTLVRKAANNSASRTDGNRSVFTTCVIR